MYLSTIRYNRHCENANITTRKKLVSKTFRITQDILNRLAQEAEDKDIHVSTLLDHILTKYLTFDLFAEKAHPVMLAEESLLSMINYLSPEQLEQAGNNAGSKVLSSLFALSNIKPSLDSVIKYHIKPMGKYSGWFSSRYYEEEQKIILHHALGTKWSHFLKGHVGASFRSVLKLDPRIELSENSVIIHLKNYVKIMERRESNKATSSTTREGSTE